MFRLGGQSDYCGKPMAVARCNARMALGPLGSVQTTVAREWARAQSPGLAGCEARWWWFRRGPATRVGVSAK